MDSAKIVDFIPAISILVSIMTITIIVLLKYGDKIFYEEYKASTILLLVTTYIFITILIVHLFREQTWTADTIKILVGALIGVGSAKLTREKSESNNSINNKGIKVAGRDINENFIQNIEKAISDIKDSVVHQNNKIEQIVDANFDNDYVINTVFSKGSHENNTTGFSSEGLRGICRNISNVIKFWHKKGWKLKHFSSDYKGMDGLFLFFEKPKRLEADDIKVYYYHGSNTSNSIEYGEIYEV